MGSGRLPRVGGAWRAVALAGLALLAGLAGCGGGAPAEALALRATPAEVLPGSEAALEATGGKPPYAFSLAAGVSGGTVDAATGAYRAGKKGGDDRCRVTDAAGATAEATVRVRAVLAVAPATAGPAPGEAVAFTASGGSPPYQFQFGDDGSRSGATLDPGSGRYVAGPRRGIDKVYVVDSTGAKAAPAVVTVAPKPLTIEPLQAKCYTEGILSFTASGGLPPHRFALASTETLADVEPNGAYRAGKMPGTDRVRVTDGEGRTAETTVLVQAQGLAIRAPAPTVQAGETVQLIGEGGSAPLKFDAVGGLGGTCEPETGRYTAPLRAGTDRVRVTDAAGATAECEVQVVVPALAIVPAEGTLEAGGEMTLAASGGVAPFRWTMDGPPGSRLDAGADGRSARYVAPRAGLPVAGARALVRVADAATPPQTAEARLSVRPARATPAVAAPDRTPPPSTRRSGPVAQLPIRRELKNGVVVIVEENHTRPVVAVSVALQGGSALDPPGKEGLTTVATEVLGEGSQGLPAGELRERLRALGAELTFNEVPGEQWTDRTQFDVEARPAHVRAVLELLATAVLRPIPTAEGIERVRGVRLAARRARDSEGTGLAWDTMLAAVFGAHPYHRPWQGTTAGLTAITADDVVAHLRTITAPSRLTVVVSGDVDRDEVAQIAQDCFGGAPLGSKVPARVAPPEGFTGFRERTATLPGGEVHLFAAFCVPGQTHPDRIAIDALARVLDYQVRLRLVSGTKVASNASAGTDLLADLGVLWIYLVTTPAQAARAELGLLDVVREVRGAPIPAEAVGREKLRLRSQEIIQRERASFRAFRFAQAESAGGIRYALGTLGRIANTTNSEVSKAAEAWLRESNLAIGRVVPAGTPDPTAEETTALGKARAKLRWDKPLARGFGKRLYTEAQVREIVDDRGRLAEESPAGASATAMFTLGNGARVWCREDRAVPLLTIAVATPAGRARDPAGGGGLASVLYSLPWRGTTARGGSDIHDFVLAHGLQFDRTLEPDYVALAASGMADDGEALATLVAEVVGRSLLRPGDFDDLWRAQQSAVTVAGQQPDLAARDMLVSVCFPNHPYGWALAGDPGRLARCGHDHVLELAHRCLRPETAHVMCTGDLPVAEMRTLIERTLGAWVSPPRVGERDISALPAVPGPWPGPRQVPIAGAGAVEVVRGGPAPAFGASDHAAMEVLRWCLHVRVRRTLVERQGIASAAKAAYRPFAAAGYWEVGATTTPERAATVRAAIAYEVARLRDEAVPADELRRIQDGISAREVREAQTGMAIALRMARDAWFGVGEGFADRFESEVAAVTPGVLQAAARKWLDPATEIEVVAGKVDAK